MENVTNSSNRNMSTVWPCQPICWTLVTPQLKNSILLEPVTLAVCITSAQHGRNGLCDSRCVQLHPTQYLNTWWEQIEDKMATAHHPLFHPLKRAHILSSAEEREEEEKKQYNAASRKASGRITWAPRLSCLYKQALIFLSSSGTSAIYSQSCGWGPAGLEKFCYSPVRPLRPVCENRFHL